MGVALYGETVSAAIDAARSPELKEVRCKDPLHVSTVEAGFGLPQRLFKPLELISASGCDWSHRVRIMPRSHTARILGIRADPYGHVYGQTRDSYAVAVAERPPGTTPAASRPEPDGSRPRCSVEINSVAPQPIISAASTKTR